MLEKNTISNFVGDQGKVKKKKSIKKIGFRQKIFFFFPIFLDNHNRTITINVMKYKFIAYEK